MTTRLHINPSIQTAAPRHFIRLPVKLNRKRIYILPTRYGVLFIVVLSALLIGSVNYKNNLGFLLTFLLGGMAFISIFHTYRNLCGIQIMSATAKPVFAGGQAVFKLHIRLENPSRTAVGFSFFGGNPLLQSLRAGADNWIHISLPAINRGILKAGALQIFTHYPLGLFRAWSTLHLDAQSLVYPKPFAGPLLWASDGKTAGEQQEKHHPGVEDFQGLNSYQPGDSMQHIAWKAFSRGQGLFTKQFIEQTGSSVMLEFDSLFELDTEHKLSRLCGMVLKAQRLNLTYGLKLPGKTIPPNTGETHYQMCLKALALYGLSSDEP